MGTEEENWREKAERREAATVACEDCTLRSDRKERGLVIAEGVVAVRPGGRPACSLQANVLRMRQ